MYNVLVVLVGCGFGLIIFLVLFMAVMTLLKDFFGIDMRDVIKRRRQRSDRVSKKERILDERIQQFDELLNEEIIK